MPPGRLIAIVLVLVVLAWPAATAQGAGGWSWPVEGAVVTPFRNGDDPYAAGQHRGIDIAAREGALVRAATAGTVRFAGVAGSSGRAVSIRTADGRFDTSYLHLGVTRVRPGDRVGLGEAVGTVGTSGRRSVSRPHLHFGVREAGTRHAYRDPLDFLPPVVPPGHPRGAPAPVAAPVSARPLAEPVRGRRRAPARRPLRVPVRPRVPVPSGRRAPLPGTGRAPLPAGRPAPIPRTAPAGRRAPLPRLGPAGEPAAVPQPAPGARPVTAPEPRGEPVGRPDLGWALACLGLLLAAACLGRRGFQGPGRERGRAALRWVMRPLTGR